MKTRNIFLALIATALSGVMAVSYTHLRSTTGTYIDFVGIDTYRHHFQTEDSFAESTRTNVPYVGKNFRMIMEMCIRDSRDPLYHQVYGRTCPPGGGGHRGFGQL